MMRLYILGGIVVAFLVLCGALWWQSGRIDTLIADKAALTASVVALELQTHLSQTAASVAEARATWFEGKARQYDALREGILRDGENADLPDWLRDVLVGLRSDTDGQTD